MEGRFQVGNHGLSLKGSAELTSSGEWVVTGRINDGPELTATAPRLNLATLAVFTRYLEEVHLG